MLLRSFEPPNLPFPASMLSIRIASMLFTCCFEALNHPIFHSRLVCYIYTYCQYVIYMLLRSFELSNLPFPASSSVYYLYLFPVCYLHAAQSSIPGYAIYFDASNHPIFHSRPVCYLYILPVCYSHAASKLRTTQSSIPGQYAIYTYLHAASKLRTTQSSIPGYAIYFEASNHLIFHYRQ